MRRSGGSALKVEGERFLVGPPKRFLDVKLERTQDVHGAEGKPKLLGESAAAAFRDILEVVGGVGVEAGVKGSWCLQMVWRG